jgi:uncharacterized protein YceK
MKRFVWFLAVAALLLGCSGLAAAQCAGNSNPGGYDLLQTFSGTQDNLSSLGLGTVSFTGVPLPGGQAGTADTIVCRITSLPNPIPSGGATLNIQVVALLLTGNTIYTNPQGQTQNVTVYATINQTQEPLQTGQTTPTYEIPLSALPQPDPLPTPSTGTMTVDSNGVFNTNSLNIQADIIVVPQGAAVTATPIFTKPMPADTISSSGSTWTTSPPAGYPTSTTFPSGGFYVNEPASGGSAVLITSRAVRGSLYALALLLAGIAVLKIRSEIKGGRLTLRPAYLVVMAAIAWFLSWKAGKLMFPTIVHAKAVSTVASCVPHTVSAWINEGGGHFVVHTIVTAVCAPSPTPTPSPSPVPTQTPVP